MTATAPETERMLTTREVADMLGVTYQFMYELRRKGEGPDWVRIGHHIRYPREAIQRFITDNTRAS